MLAVEVGDYGQNGRELEEGASLSSASATRYCDSPKVGVRTERVHATAYDHGWIKPAC